MRRHSFALVLLGWYLLIPNVDSQLKYDTRMSRWRQFWAYDSVAACQEDRSRMVTHAARDWREWEQAIKAGRATKRQMEASEIVQWEAQVSLSACVESNDPRLAR